MSGYDISANAVEIARKISSRFRLDMSFGELDLTAQDLSVPGATLLTCYALEQLKYHTEEVLTRMLSWKPAQVIHMEPVAEFYNPLKPRDLLGIGYVRWKDYQDNLYTTLRRLEGRGWVKILNACRLGLAGNGLNEISFIRWRPA